MSSAKNKSHFKAIIQHPVQIERIPHIVAAVTVMYMFAFLFLCIGFLSASHTVQKPSALVPAQQETVDFFPVELDQPTNQEQDFFNNQQNNQDFYYDQPYNQEDVLGQDSVNNPVSMYQDESKIYYTAEEENVNLDNEYQIYPVEYSQEGYTYAEDNDPYLNEGYYDEEYYNYWEEDLGSDMYYQDTQPVVDTPQADVYVAQPLKTTFSSRLNNTASSESLLFVGFSVLAMGILVFFVNHIHENNHFLHKPHHKIRKSK